MGIRGGVPYIKWAFCTPIQVYDVCAYRYRVWLRVFYYPLTCIHWCICGSCFVFYRLDSKNQYGYQWILLCYTPGAPRCVPPCCHFIIIIISMILCFSYSGLFFFFITKEKRQRIGSTRGWMGMVGMWAYTHSHTHSYTRTYSTLTLAHRQCACPRKDAVRLDAVDDEEGVWGAPAER